ncbi:MAG: hypothetical protein GY940_42175 [bacterium]|nr:hypothetical protein [bacterium]
MKTILISLYLSEEKALKCRPFFEELDKCLSAHDTRLNLLNLSTPSPRIECLSLDSNNPPVKDNAAGLAGIENFDKFFEVALSRDTPRDCQNVAPIRSLLKNRFRSFALWVDHIRPDFVFLWHQFRGLHYLAAKLLEQKNIPFGFTHLGVLPETIVFESDGEMGESWVARESARFRSLPVNEEELERAQKYIDFVVAHKLDRKPQTENKEFDTLVNRARAENRKIVFYAGQFDRYAGLVPYDDSGKKYHSPNYTGTLDALVHLDEMARQNQWAIFFKPHPSDVPVLPDHLDLQCTYFIPGANVFDCMYQSDVTVTILSTVSYLSRLHGRPTVMLGRHQVSGKGCVYECRDREEAESVIKLAMETGKGTGYPRQMENAWVEHIAQLLKYYLYPLTPEVREIIGREIVDLAAYIINEALGTG